MENEKISIVICTCNRAEMLCGAIASLQAQHSLPGLQGEIVVIDDGSVDATAVVVEAMGREGGQYPIRYFYKSPEGLAAARNLGVHCAKGEWIAFFDDDQCAEPGWLAALLQTAAEERADCVGGSVKLQLPASATLQLGKKARRILGERHGGVKSKVYSSNDDPGTGNVLFAKKAFLAVGGFDVCMREGGEDTEFFARLRRHGFSIWYAPEALVWHVLPPARLTRDFLHWVSRKGGVAAVRSDRKHKGILSILYRIGFRVGLSFFRDLPLFLVARLKGDEALEMDVACTLGHSIGYLRGCLYFWAPHFFEQKNFMAYADFRRHGGERAA